MAFQALIKFLTSLTDRGSALELASEDANATESTTDDPETILNKTFATNESTKQEDGKSKTRKISVCTVAVKSSMMPGRCYTLANKE